MTFRIPVTSTRLVTGAVLAVLVLSSCSSADSTRQAGAVESASSVPSGSSEPTAEPTEEPTEEPSTDPGSGEPTPEESSPSPAASSDESDDEASPLVGAVSGCTDAGNWMSCMFPRGDVKLTDISLPGSHDSATYSINSDGEFAWNCGDNNSRKAPAGVVTRWARTQEVTPAQAAASGVRYFDLRPFFARDGSLRTCHSYIGASMSDAVGKGAFGGDNFVNFVKSHPNEVFIIDFNGTFADQNDPGSPEHVKQLKSWVADDLGDVVFGPAHTQAKNLSEVSLAEMRKAGRNVVVLGFGDLVSGASEGKGLLWDRNGNAQGRNLYSCWTDDSDAAKAWWASGEDRGSSQEAVMKYIKRELDCLKGAPGKSVNVLNFIVDTSCPGNAVWCGGAWATGSGTVKVTKEYFDPMVRALARRVGQTGTPAVIMRDVAHTSQNKWIWDLNTGKES